MNTPFFVALLTTLLTACAAPPAPYAGQVCGRAVVYHPDDLSRCIGDASACTEGARDIYYSTRETAVLAHEEEHICGMVHREPWVALPGKNCTTVTDGGSTSWRAGDVMCRLDAGAPVKVDARTAAIVRELQQ